MAATIPKQMYGWFNPTTKLIKCHSFRESGKNALRHLQRNNDKNITRSSSKCMYSTVGDDKFSNQSQKSNSKVTNENKTVSSHKTQNSEDFFGIPDQFKLNHVRFDCTDTNNYQSVNRRLVSPRSKNASNATNGEINDQNSSQDNMQETNVNTHSPLYSLNSETYKRRRRRTIVQTSFPTSFGIISFDKTANIGQAELALKAEALTKTTFKTNTSHFYQNNLERSTTAFNHDDRLKHSNETVSHSNIIEDQFFAALHSKEEKCAKDDNGPTNYFDEHFFGDVSQLEKSHSSILEENINSNSTKSMQQEKMNTGQSERNTTEIKENLNLSKSIGQEQDLNEVDQQFFGGIASQGQKHPPSLEDITQNYSQFQSQSDDLNRLHDSFSTNFQGEKSSGKGHLGRPSKTNHSSSISSQPSTNQESLQDVITNDVFFKRQTRKKKSHAVNARQTVNDETDSAYSFAMKVQQDLRFEEEGKSRSLRVPKQFDTPAENPSTDEASSTSYSFDSKGYRILQNLPNYDKMTSADVTRMLKSRIIFNHDDFLAIDKPYGLPSFGQKEDRLSISGLLPSLVSSLPRSYRVDDLHIVQGLDRDVTGAVILAKTPEVAQVLKGMLNSSGGAIQRYWAITKGVPKCPEGTIDIPIGDGRVNGIHRRMLRPLYKHTGRPGVKLSKAPSQAAVTDYKLLSRNQTAALLECSPLTNGVKHQLRVHLAYGINTPILGDHKYSHFSRLAPQKLDPASLALLKIRQAKVRHLALHLHLQSLVLTDYNGRMIFLTTRPPKHFIDSLNSLKLYMPKK